MCLQTSTTNTTTPSTAWHQRPVDNMLLCIVIPYACKTENTRPTATLLTLAIKTKNPSKQIVSSFFNHKSKVRFA